MAGGLDETDIYDILILINMADKKNDKQELQNALEKANREIEKLSRIKSDFVSVISHELRTPLTSIKESISLILDGVTGPATEEQKKFLTIAKNNVERLAKLITDILDLSKLESGRIMMHKRKLNINDIIKDIYVSMKVMAEQKNLEFTISLKDSVEPIWIDPDRIGQVIKNLVSNAIKFNKDKGRINISTTTENIKGKDYVKIAVEDNGIGIPQDEIENLFRHFTPLDTSMTRQHNGAGMGLAISKGIVELHGGSIWVVSERDTGSKVIFTIPIYRKYEEFDFLMEESIERARHNDNKVALIVFDVKEAKDKAEGVISEAEDIIKKTIRGPEDKVTRCKKGECIVVIVCADRPGALAIIRRVRENINVPLLFGISVYPDESADMDELMKKTEADLRSGKNLIAPKKILLIIDDEEDLTSMLSFRLKNMGFDAITAASGKRGVELARDTRPDLILLDLMMPGVDGFEVSERLKSDPLTKDIPIIIFSALGNKNTKETVEKMGAAGFIEKPFEPELLIDKIRELLEAKDG
ncbi:MAG: ATP-binding protein [Candidatus Omnitrophota bacterium]|nr:ATP-binding protein [Candidatus Omnitrophota bacterium]